MNELLSNPPPTRQATTTRAPIANRTPAPMDITALSNALGGNMEDLSVLGNMDQNRKLILFNFYDFFLFLELMRLFAHMNGGAGVGTAELANLVRLANNAK